MDMLLNILPLVAYPIFLYAACRYQVVKGQKFQFRITDIWAFILAFLPTPAILAYGLQGNQTALNIVFFTGLGQLAGAVVGCLYACARSFDAFNSALEVAAWTLIGGVIFPIAYAILLMLIISPIVVVVATSGYALIPIGAILLASRKKRFP